MGDIVLFCLVLAAPFLFCMIVLSAVISFASIDGDECAAAVIRAREASADLQQGDGP